MSSSPPEVTSLFRAQRGVILRRQAIALGLTSKQIDYRLKTNQWMLFSRGIYRHPLYVENAMMHAIALTLDGRGALSHRSAAKQHGLDPCLEGRPEVTVQRGRHLEAPALLLHETTQLDKASPVIIKGMLTTGVERTLMDCCAVVRKEWKRLALIDSARSQAKTDLAKLWACLETHARRGRDGTVNFRLALEKITCEERPAIGLFNREVAESLFAVGVPYPRMEHRILNPLGGTLSQVDLCWPELRICVEFDGFAVHGRREQSNKDRRTRGRLRELGWTVFEVTYDNWKSDPAAVIAAIRSAVFTALNWAAPTAQSS